MATATEEAETEEKKKFDDLKFVRINNPGTDSGIIDMVFRSIPRELFEQVKDIEINLDLLYQSPAMFISDLNTRFYVLVDSEEKIKGFLWAYMNVLLDAIQIQMFSLDKEYQFIDALKETLKFIESWMGEKKVKIQCLTSKPHPYQKLGGKISKLVLVESG